MARPRVLLLCGGESGEHEVSLASARSVLAAGADRFEITPLVIDKAGKLLAPSESARALARGVAEAGEGRSSLALLQANGITEGGPGDGAGASPAAGHGDSRSFDVVFPLLHGPNGEDGTVQGLLELLRLPFVGSGVLGSAVGMDKLMMKTVFAASGLPQVPYRGVTREAWRRDRTGILAAFDLRFPIFVKPANLGSSVGIAKAYDEEALTTAIDGAFRFDRRVILEESVDGARELEVGVLGNDLPQVSPVGEILFDGDFYDYDSKYTEGRSRLTIPAQISEGTARRCEDLALRAFTAIDAAGLARVDFFYREESDELLVNEINTMPGFTTTSMYPKLWAAAGIDYGELVGRLVDLALEPR